jgi:DNA-binding transcriptional ArsR family regulator
MSPPAARPARARAAVTAARPAISSDSARAAHVAEVLKAVAHPLRLRIIAILVEEDANVGALAERLGAEQAIVSQQLRILRHNGLVAADREGGFATYRLVERNLEALVACMERCGR